MPRSACGQCGQPFTSVTAFDRHQDVDYSRSQAVKCRDPREAGLVLRSTGWSLPGPDAWRVLRARSRRSA